MPKVKSQDYLIVFNGDLRVRVKNKAGIWGMEEPCEELPAQCFGIKDKSFQKFCEKLQLTAKRKIVNLF